MKISTNNIKEFKRKNDYLVCIDSDGCAFDAMDIKWKECFIPALIKCFELQPIAKYVREEAEHINLYSRTRGVNRFIGLPLLFKALEAREEIKAYDFQLPNIDGLLKWIEETEQLSPQSLRNKVDEIGDELLKKTLAWTVEASKNIEETVYGIPPFPGVKESIDKLSRTCDIAVVSSATLEAVRGEWEEHDLLQYVDVLCTQEVGSKKECIRILKEQGYKNENIIMIGDALGDMEAAHDNGVLFYPIRPGQEVQCWKEFCDNNIESFRKGTYKLENEEEYINKFLTILK